MLDDRDLRFDLFALGLLAFTIFLGLSLLTYSPADPLSEAVFPLNLVYTPNQIAYPLNSEINNACGHAGATCADILLRVFGVGAYYVVTCIAIADALMLMRRPIHGACIRLVGWLISLVGILTLIQMFMSGIGYGTVIGPGGYLGAVGRTFLEAHFATAGSLILLGCVIVCGALMCTDYALVQIAIFTATAIINMMPRVRLDIATRIQDLIAQRRRIAQSRDAAAEEEEYEDEEVDEYEYEEIEPASRRRHVVNDLSEPVTIDEEEEEEDYEEEQYEEELDGEMADDADDSELEGAAAAGEDTSSASSTVAATGRGKRAGADREEVMAQLEEASREYDPQDYELPPRDLLIHAESYNVEELTKEVKRKASLLEKTFEDFNLDVKVVDIETGPVIAQYEVALKRGLRLSKITGLADDLAIALRVPSVRIVAPIPGKNTVGIEVPNDRRQIVRLREVMNETAGRMKRMAVPIFLGKDVSGNPLAVDLAKLPHLLIAGRTGTGKSVCLNAIISSILMTKTPDDVRLLMIDPKMVELSGYARLPHLMHPVVTDMRKAEAILAWACDKMDERYQLLARAGVRHISSYNQLGEEELMERLQPETEDEKKLVPRHLPFIVIVADEMADLMMTAGKEVEAHIIRLAAKSRAVGIHLILATQKPTVDVITGLIKSNLPARIAFQVASKIDSRVVLDENGADKLLGHGDMLFLSPGTSTLVRGQGTYMSDGEIDRIVDYCGSKGEQHFVRELVQLKVEDKETGEAIDLKKRDDLYEEAVEVVIREGRGSVSLLQRNLQIGYGRAARLIDFMAEDGIVGAYNGSQAREVLMTLADWEAMKSSGRPPTGGDVVPQTMSQIIAPSTAAAAVPTELEDDSDDEIADEFAVLPSRQHLEVDQLEEDEDEVEEDEWEDDELEEGELEEGESEIEYEDDDELEEDELEEDELEEDELEEDELEEDDDELEEDELEEEDEPEYDEVAEELDEAEYDEAESELDEDEFEQADYDDKEFQAAVAKQTGFSADEYLDVDDFEDELAEAQETGEIESPPRRKTGGRTAGRSDDPHTIPHGRHENPKRSRARRSHAK